MPSTRAGESAAGQARSHDRPLPVWRIGIAGGLAGVIGAGTAFSWATNLYDGYKWWFRIAGLGVLALLVVVALRRRNQCSLDGARTVYRRLVAVVAIAVATYLLLYGVTTWLGRLA